ncbi:membrane protein [Geomonas limicola]|uniref:Membrane protein n=1 Tax=Geomonas limicola TaxID=2740186 RepID=A0A6V8N223_9BACT|nr:DUF2231 domain-containing protein [Geomonas limicola]GFO66522.1 membrane protein [Geomonas limicola]
MLAKARISKHPIHPMIVPFPIGLLGGSLICDLIGLWTRNPLWPVFAAYLIAGGVLAALAAALPGLIDLVAIHREPVKKLGIYHMSCNLLVVAIFLVDLWWRLRVPFSAGQVLLSAGGILLLMISGWLGGELVYVHRAAVDETPRTD